MFQRILITGAAGFIGFHLANRLCKEGRAVLGYDNCNHYYDVGLKTDRLSILRAHKNFEFVQADIADEDALDAAFKKFRPDVVVNLAAQAGVRYSIENPRAYVHSNIDGFINILEACRHHKIKHLVYASSSSVYGANAHVPFSVQDNVDHPVSLYAATKKANELMAHSYAHLYGLPCTGLRFFTVYGPWGRPDMAYFKFTRSIYEGEAINIHNGGDMRRDLTYIDDIIGAMTLLIDRPAMADPAWNAESPDPSSSTAPYRLYNIGNNKPVPLLKMIEIIEREIGVTAVRNMLPMQAGEVPETFADIDSLKSAINFTPATDFESGLTQFVRWYREYYKMGNGPVTAAEG